MQYYAFILLSFFFGATTYVHQNIYKPVRRRTLPVQNGLALQILDVVSELCLIVALAMLFIGGPVKRASLLAVIAILYYLAIHQAFLRQEIRRLLRDEPKLDYQAAVRRMRRRHAMPF